MLITCRHFLTFPEGTITQNWSGTVIEYQKLLSVVNWTDYNITGKSSGSLKTHSTYIGRVVEETWLSYRTAALTATGILAVALGYTLRSPLQLGTSIAGKGR